jgi:hypothetical protein
VFLLSGWHLSEAILLGEGTLLPQAQLTWGYRLGSLPLAPNVLMSLAMGNDFSFPERQRPRLFVSPGILVDWSLSKYVYDMSLYACLGLKIVIYLGPLEKWTPLFLRQANNSVLNSLLKVQ